MVIHVPRTGSTVVAFSRDLPQELGGVLTAEQFARAVDAINTALARAYRPRLWEFVSGFFLWICSARRPDLESVVASVNRELESSGVRVEDPRKTGMLALNFVVCGADGVWPASDGR